MALVLLAEFSTMTDLQGGRESKALRHVAMAGVAARERLLETHCHPMSYSHTLPCLLTNACAPLSAQVGKRLEPGYRPESASHA